MNETELFAAVYDLTAFFGILAFHSGDSRRDYGKGYPDMTLIGRNSTMWAELKGPVGTLTTEQTLWKWRIIAAGGHWELWRPADLESGHIRRVLTLLLRAHEGYTPVLDVNGVDQGACGNSDANCSR